jgi:hypothetical protein
MVGVFFIKNFSSQNFALLYNKKKLAFFSGIILYLLKSRFAYGEIYGTLNSLNTRDFMQKLQQVTPFKISRIQTDNGLEFGKYFAEHL